MRQDAKVENESKSGKTALHFASTFGHLEIVEALCECKGTSLAKQDESGMTPLMLAVASGRNEMSELLLEKKCSVQALIDKVNKRGMTALAIAASNQQLECCKLLINHSADMYIQDENGQLPVDHAEGTLNAKVVELFRSSMLERPQQD